MSDENEIIINKMLFKTKHKYARPARFYTNTKYTVFAPDKEYEFYCGGRFKSVREVLAWAKQKFGDSYKYKVSPYVSVYYQNEQS